MLKAYLQRSLQFGPQGYVLLIERPYTQMVSAATISISYHTAKDTETNDLPISTLRKDDLSVLIAIGKALQAEGLLEDLNADAAELKATKFHLQDMRLLANVSLVVKDEDM